MLTGQAKTDYQREYMRKRRSLQPKRTRLTSGVKIGKPLQAQEQGCMNDCRGKILIDGEPVSMTVVEYRAYEIQTAKDEDRSRRRKCRYTVEYKRWRLSVLERDNFTCTSCGSVGGHLESHHIKSYAKNPDVRTDIDNGVTLCYDCHSALHGTTWGWFYKNKSPDNKYVKMGNR